MASVVLQAVTKRYGDHQPVISGVDLEIRERELMVHVFEPASGERL